MVTIVDTPALTRSPTHIGIERCLAELVDRTEADFARWPQFGESARLASYSKVGVLELMPTADGEWFSFKRVSGHPGNAAAGLLTVTAIGMLAKVAAGYLRLVCEMTLQPALRTAATSAMAARRFANSGVSTMALIGTGAHSEVQALALKASLGVRRVRHVAGRAH